MSQKAIDFFKEFPPTKQKNGYELRANSANAMFCIYEFWNRDETYGNFIIKLQKDIRSDPISKDIYINETINDNGAVPPHFMKLVSYFPAFIVKGDNGALFLKPSSAEGTSQEQGTYQPCVVVAKVDNACTFWHLQQQRRLDPVALPLARLFRSMIVIGAKAGFSHNDLHGGNILFNTKSKEFTLIDYGRAELEKFPIQQFHLTNIIKNLHIANASSRYTNILNNQYIPSSKYFGFPDSVEYYIYALNDVAGLTKYLIDSLQDKHLTNTVQAFYESYVGVYLYDPSSENLAKVKSDLIALYRNHPLAFALSIGYVWMCVLETAWEDELKPMLKQRNHPYWTRKLWISNPYACVMNSDVFRMCLDHRPMTTYVSKCVLTWVEVLDMKKDQSGSGVLDDISVQAPEDVLEDYIQGKMVSEDLAKQARLAHPNTVAAHNTFIPLPNVVQSAVPQNIFAPQAIQVASGNRSDVPTYVVKHERQTRRRYIIKSRSKWYLDKHRGQYRYTDSARNTLFLIGSATK